MSRAPANSIIRRCIVYLSLVRYKLKYVTYDFLARKAKVKEISALVSTVIANAVNGKIEIEQNCYSLDSNDET